MYRYQYAMATTSPFTVSSTEANRLVQQCNKDDNHRHCYLLQVSFQPVYGDVEIPQSVYKKLPRLVNGIPLGAGRMTRQDVCGIRWRYLEGNPQRALCFLSNPMIQEDAEETRRLLKDQLILQSQHLFGEITVKTNVILSQCLNFDEDFFVNDIALCLNEGLHFLD